jgi:N-acetylneuraminate synthase
MPAPEQKTYIIAEAGVNHDGDEERALGLIDIAVEAGADAVKFQLFTPDALVTKDAETADYQQQNLNDQNISQLDMLRLLTLPVGALVRLSEHCKIRGIDFLCTPFDKESLDYLIEREIPMRYLKLASGEVTNGPLLLAAARTGKPIILSTGMANIEEIREALAILYFGYNFLNAHPKELELAPAMLEFLRERVTLLHCVSQYPAPLSSMNLRAINTLAAEFSLPVGLSDHSPGINSTLAAVARGAAMIEKHFTYDVGATGPDHAASLSPQELKGMVAAIREVESTLGDGRKICQPEEENTRLVARRSVVAATAITKGEIFSEENICCKRPALGEVAPNNFWKLLGKKAGRDYSADDFIAAREIE